MLKGLRSEKQIKVQSRKTDSAHNCSSRKAVVDSVRDMTFTRLNNNRRHQASYSCSAGQDPGSGASATQQHKAAQWVRRRPCLWNGRNGRSEVAQSLQVGIGFHDAAFPRCFGEKEHVETIDPAVRPKYSPSGPVEDHRPLLSIVHQAQR
jgi:hypothetical protein